MFGLNSPTAKGLLQQGPSVLAASEPPEIGAGATPIVKRLDIDE
jgi:hypothetical protein